DTAQQATVALYQGEHLPPVQKKLRELRELLLKAAPSNAVGYRMGLHQDNTEELIWFPHFSGKKRKRFDGTWTDLPYFELHPHFEPPRVPVVAHYDLRFV